MSFYEGDTRVFFFEDADDEALFDALIPAVAEHALVSDPLAPTQGDVVGESRAGGREPHPSGENAAGAKALEVIQLPPDSLSPRLEAQEVQGLELVLKEAIALRILRAVDRRPGAGQGRSSEKCLRSVLGSAADIFGEAPALLVVTAALD